MDIKNIYHGSSNIEKYIPNKTFIIHLLYGIGKYIGVTLLNINNITREFLTIEYANKDKLYVPIQDIYLIYQYKGIKKNPDLHILGSKKWKKIKLSITNKIQDIAVDLLEIYAKRQKIYKNIVPYKKPTEEYRNFCKKFPFQETPDQILAIDAIIKDMMDNKIMDRLLCGDVGFGKTEVAMRAAYFTILNNKQVILLVPNTLLAQQHYKNFLNRFFQTKVNITLITRREKNKDHLKKMLVEIQKKKYHIIIGTHKLLTINLQLENLGLIIIDEEHRFGVYQKDQLKKLSYKAHILTLTATPIPRTLYFSLSKIRDLSLISTPPNRRLNVKTFIKKYDISLIKDILMNEINRGGQVFYLYNEIHNIEKKAQQIKNWFPFLKIGVAHGRMDSNKLRSVMDDFYHNRKNILVCSTIIETGIDIPNANLIIIEKSHKFGLSQLHQLRGRVGRSYKQAYAYLLIPEELTKAKNLYQDAKKRLKSISKTKSLGGGYLLSNHDLEIRGSGNILGKEQSGYIEDIGLSIYNDLLSKSIDILKTQKDSQKKIIPINIYKKCEVDLGITALIPSYFIQDISLRLYFYKLLSNANTDKEIYEIKLKIKNKFGSIPEPFQVLFEIARLKFRANYLGINKIRLQKIKNGSIEFSKNCTFDPKKIIDLICKYPANFKLEKKDNILKINYFWNSTEERLNFIMQILIFLKTGIFSGN